MGTVTSYVDADVINGVLHLEKMNFVGNVEGVPLLATKDLNRSEADAFYWLGDSFVVNRTYYVFGLYIAKEGPLGFNQVGEDLDERVRISRWLGRDKQGREHRDN